MPSLRRKASVPKASEPPAMSLREQLRRANITVGGDTYDVLTGKISEEEYHRRIGLEDDGGKPHQKRS
jgi:hypothetical protein